MRSLVECSLKRNSENRCGGQAPGIDAAALHTDIQCATHEKNGSTQITHTLRVTERRPSMSPGIKSWLQFVLAIPSPRFIVVQ